MTTEHIGTKAYEAPSSVPEDILLARDRIANHRAKAARSIGRGRYRRRFLPAAVVASATLVTAGLADRFVQVSLARTATAVIAPTAAPSSLATSKALAMVTKTLAADQQAIAALAKTQAQLARSAQSDGGTSVPSSASSPSLQLPSLPSLPSVPSIPSIPAIATPAPATHATTGASVVLP